jgi:hypothetical protein
MKSLRVAVTAFLNSSQTSHVARNGNANVEHDGFVRELSSRQRAHRAVCYHLRPGAVSGSPFFYKRSPFQRDMAAEIG